MALLVHGGHVLTPSATALERADILLDADRIRAVGPALACAPDTPRLDATGCLVLPGLVNAHTHAHNNLGKGLGKYSANPPPPSEK
jgi:cytosine/adenosine deaminase-related metal-dependent hydrolase